MTFDEIIEGLRSGDIGAAAIVEPRDWYQSTTLLNALTPPTLGGANAIVYSAFAQGKQPIESVVEQAIDPNSAIKLDDELIVIRGFGDNDGATTTLRALMMNPPPPIQLPPSMAAAGVPRAPQGLSTPATGAGKKRMVSERSPPSAPAAGPSGDLRNAVVIFYEEAKGEHAKLSPNYLINIEYGDLVLKSQTHLFQFLKCKHFNNEGSEHTSGRCYRFSTGRPSFISDECRNPLATAACDHSRRREGLIFGWVRDHTLYREN